MQSVAQEQPLALTVTSHCPTNGKEEEVNDKMGRGGDDGEKVEALRLRLMVKMRKGQVGNKNGSTWYFHCKIY